MSESKRDALDEALAALPREVQPERDLWPTIRAGIETTPSASGADRSNVEVRSRWFQLAAGVLLVVGSSFTTYVVMRRAMQEEVARIVQEDMPAPAVSATPVSFSFGPETLGRDYLDARAALDEVFRQRLASLPPSARAKLERNLADLRQAADEISATLAEHPSDPLLQELLMSTYHSELRLLADVSELPVTSSMRADL